MATVTPQEADAFLREIRSKKGVDDPRGSHYDNVEDLNKSLILLADQLYTKPTHFLLELIQNADDNNFTNPTPTLSFTLQKESRELRVDCNETGFTKENVKAICSIGRSTKGVVDRTKGFIGEKGIGFKSSFKVADVVHIASGPFQFKFDRRQTLGMIAPIPEPFPQGQKLPGQTQILLYLNSQDEVTIISDELKTIRSQLLIFLRKLSAITVKAPSRDIQFRISRKSYDVLLKGETAELTTTLKGFYELSRRKYVIVCFAVYDLPKDDRRPGVQESEIVLAFPVAEWSIHFSRSMTTDFLQYLIQADFILVANREAIELYAEWNFWVRQHIIEAFAKAVQRFVSIKGSSPASGLRYTWPVFLKDRGGTTVDFWSTLKISILEDLKSERILESRDDTAGLCFPTELWYIPYRFRLAGEPLVEEGNTRKSHLSFHYDTESSGMSRELSLIGVSEMTADRFFEELKSVVSRNSTFLQSQSTEWHAAVAKILQSEINPTRLANIPLIPLRNGKWVTHLAGKIFLDSEVDALTIPWCVDIEIVDATACKNRARRQLFKWLGIKTCDQADICRLILEQQDHYPFMFNANDPLESKLLIIDDAFYLFNTPTHVFNKSISKLYVLDDHGAIVHGKSLYVDYAIKGFRISSYANIEDSGVRMLHSRYLTRARKDGRETEFVKWLIRRLQVSTLPCLVRKRQITQESRYFTTKAHLDLLLLLRDNWSHYCTQLWDMTPGDISSQSTALKELSFMKVKCTDGKFYTLRETVLPLQRLKQAGSYLPFLDIPNPEDRNWANFQRLGVIAQESLEFYFRQLKAISSGSFSNQVTKSIVQELYIQIAHHWATGPTISVKSEFESSAFVFHEKENRWMYLRDCVWEAPACLTRVIALERQYKDCKLLFCTLLGLKNATLEHVVDEILNPQSRDLNQQAAQQKQLLLVVNDFLRRNVSSGPIEKLMGKDVIPVVKSAPGREMSDLVNYDRHIWYFADRPSLRESFKEKVWLIDFPVDVVRKLSPLIKAMGLEEYRLSAAVVEETECNGDPILDQDRTMDLRARAQYFMRLVPETNRDGKKQLTSRLQSLAVWGVTAIKLKRRINDIEGIEDSGDIVFKEKSTQLDIYIPIDIENQCVFVYQLSENLIKHCGITDSRHQKLVQPILSAPISRIPKLLEQFDLDGQLEADAGSSLPVSFLDSVQAQDPRNTFRTSTAPYSASRFESTGNETFFTSRPPITGSVSSLRTSIPTLDQSIASVRQAAASEDRSSSFTVFGPQITTQNISASSTTEHSDIRDDSGFVDELTDSNISSNGRVRGINDDEDGKGGVFGVAALRSALAETTESCPRMSFGGSRFTGSPSYSRSQGRYFAAPVDKESSVQSLHNRHIGLLGETFIYEHFSTRLPNWGASNWTSKSRVEAGHPPFTELEKDYADFTYVDSGWALTTLLSQMGFKMTDAWPRSEKAPTYHLEVKSTTEKCNEPFYMSNNQVEKARDYKLSVSIATPLDVYVILRVYDLQEPGSTPRFMAYVDPWSMYLQQSLTLRAWDKYVVTLN